MERGVVGRVRREEWWLPLLGKPIDRWEVIEVLGQGGMSVVFRARHLWLAREAAIKLLSPELSSNETIQERFQQEAQTLSRFDHPHILRILDFGLDAEHGYFMVLECLEGHDLRHWIRRAPMPKALLWSLFSQICDALDVAHQAGVIHRDIKPTNLFVLEYTGGTTEHKTPHVTGETTKHKTPHVKLLDFGVAKLLDIQRDKELTATGMIMGTPAYLAPEQLKPKARLSPATDLYALGVILFEILCGRLPFNGADVLEHAMLVVAQAPPRLGQIRPRFARTDIESLIHDLLQKDPAQRPPSVSVFRQRLHNALKDLDETIWTHSLPSSDSFPSSGGSRTAPIISGDSLQETSEPSAAWFSGGLRTAPTKSGDSPQETSEPSAAWALALQETDTPSLLKQDMDTPSPLIRDVEPPSLLKQEMGIPPEQEMRIPPEQEMGIPPEDRAESMETEGSGSARRWIVWACVLGVLVLGWWFRSFLQTPQGDLFGKKGINQELSKKGVPPKRGVASVKSARPLAKFEHLEKAKEAGDTKGQADAPKDTGDTKGQADPLKESDEQLMRAVRLGVQSKQAHREGAKWFAAFRLHLSERRWFLAHAAYQRLQASVPLSASFQLEIVRLLGEQSPSLGVWHGESVLRRLSLSAAQRREVEKILLSLKRAQQQQLALLRKSFARAEEDAKAGRWDAAKAAVKAIVDEPSFAFRASRTVWMDGLRGMVLSAPRFVLSAWLLYEASVERVRGDGLGSWVKMESPDFPSSESLRQQSESLRLHHQFAEAMANLEKAEESSDLRKAQECAEKAERAWKQFLLLDTWGFSKVAAPRYRRLQAGAALYARGVVLERAYNKALREARHKQAKSAKEALRVLLEGTTLQEPMQRRFRREDERLQRSLRELARGDLAYRKKRWKAAHDAYHSYLQLSPKAWNRRQITQRIKSCGCALGYPWVSCRKTDFPK